MNVTRSIQSSFSKSVDEIKNRKGLVYLLIFILALVAFESFNFSTTDFALSDLLGDLRFIGIRWATLLSIAFCGIDFAGIARLFTPQTERDEARKVWYLFGAWFMAATMNAILTWWGVVIAIQTHAVVSTGMVNATFVTKIVPIFIALMVWVIRILLVGTLSKKSDQLISGENTPPKSSLSRRELRQAQSNAAQVASSMRSVPLGFKGTAAGNGSRAKNFSRPEPSYIPMQEDAGYHGYQPTTASRK
jgi:hypothetical protein